MYKNVVVHCARRICIQRDENDSICPRSWSANCWFCPWWYRGFCVFPLGCTVVGLPSNSYKPITNTACVRARLCKLQKGCTRLESDKVYQLFAHGRWFSPGTPVSFTTKTGRHGIAEILLKVALNTKKIKIKSIYFCNILSYLYRQPGIAGVNIVQISNVSMLLSVHSSSSIDANKIWNPNSCSYWYKSNIKEFVGNTYHRHSWLYLFRFFYNWKPRFYSCVEVYLLIAV